MDFTKGDLAKSYFIARGYISGSLCLSLRICIRSLMSILNIGHRVIIVSLDESRGYLGFSAVTLLQRFPFGRDILKNILVRPFKFGMCVYMGNATNAIVL